VLQVITSSGGEETKQSRHALSYLVQFVGYVQEDLSQIFSYKYSLMCDFRDFTKIWFAFSMYI
jgi:hypothetical protein